MKALNAIAEWLYQLIQLLISIVFSPHPPPPNRRLRGPRIAVIGTGITGVSSAAHCIGHGFEVTLFEAGGPENVGGIWTHVNNTSSLQVHSVMYRFHPTIRFRSKYPDRQRVVEEVTKLWKRYHLDERTKFGVRVESVYRDEKTGKWIVQDPSYGAFDGVIAAVGTCGTPNMPHLPGQEKFEGEIWHSSELTGKDAKDKKVIVVGGGASAIEAVEFVVDQKAAFTSILARKDKWIIPRNIVIDSLLSMNILGEETTLSIIPEWLLRKLFYWDLEDLSPAKTGLYTETPMVNNEILNEIRSGKVQWLRGDIIDCQPGGVRFNRREKGVPKGGPGHECSVDGDMLIMATGFHRPSLKFLPDDAFTSPYAPPNWFLQTFPVGYPDICAINSTYVNAIGTVGNIHIGIYTRYLLMCLADPSTRPTKTRMRAWIDLTRVLKENAPGGALNFFSYSELIWWFMFSLASSPFRWKWILFVMLGWGRALPAEAEGEAQVNGDSSAD